MVYLKDGMQPIHKALTFARNDVVELFLSIEPSTAEIPYRDIPIVHLALSLAGFESYRDQCIKCLDLLLNNGANEHAIDRLGRNILHWTAFYNMTEVTKQLLAKGLDGKEEDYGEMTPIDICIERDNLETLLVFVRFLITLD